MATKSGTWRIWFSDLLLATGGLILLVGVLFGTRTALAAGQINDYRYLPPPLQPALPLPVLYSTGIAANLSLSPVPVSPESVPASPQPETSPAALAALPGQAAGAYPPPATPAAEMPAQTAAPGGAPAPSGPAETAPLPTALPPTPAPAEAIPTEIPPTPAPAEAVPTEIPPTPAPVTETPLPTPTPSPIPTEGIPAYSPVVRLVIPALDIDRTVIPVGMRPVGGGGLEWDTDPLFATQNRPDLVGQLMGSYSPGQGGNILLIGHNYNQVDWGWTGVFVNIKNLAAGDQLTVFTEDGRQTIYQVVQVKQVPWRNKNANELEKHMKFMGHTDGERLTLITCGGANIWPFPARVYVVADPVVAPEAEPPPVYIWMKILSNLPLELRVQSNHGLPGRLRPTGSPKDFIGGF